MTDGHEQWSEATVSEHRPHRSTAHWGHGGAVGRNRLTTAVIHEGTQKGGSLFQAQASGGGVCPRRSPSDLEGLCVSLFWPCVWWAGSASWRQDGDAALTHWLSGKMGVPRQDNKKDIKRGKQEAQLGGQSTNPGWGGQSTEGWAPERHEKKPGSSEVTRDQEALGESGLSAWENKSSARQDGEFENRRCQGEDTSVTDLEQPDVKTVVLRREMWRCLKNHDNTI